VERGVLCTTALRSEVGVLTGSIDALGKQELCLRRAVFTRWMLCKKWRHWSKKSFSLRRRCLGVSALFQCREQRKLPTLLSSQRLLQLLKVHRPPPRRMLSKPASLEWRGAIGL